jgi:hypothetical protein
LGLRLGRMPAADDRCDTWIDMNRWGVAKW